jgi:hypothetical protein
MGRQKQKKQRRAPDAGIRVDHMSREELAQKAARLVTGYALLDLTHAGLPEALMFGPVPGARVFVLSGPSSRKKVAAMLYGGSVDRLCAKAHRSVETLGSLLVAFPVEELRRVLGPEVTAGVISKKTGGRDTYTMFQAEVIKAADPWSMDGVNVHYVPATSAP